MIDIIIPAYNANKTINRTLASLVAQIDQNFEVYVIDDASPEPVKEICDKYISDLTLHYIYSEVNQGCGMSRQVGIDASNNKFMMFLDADDVLMPYTIRLYNDIIRDNPDIEYIHVPVWRDEKDAAGRIRLNLEKNLFTPIHGKLYNREKLNEYGIKNDPICSRWADDSYFNSQCAELLEFTYLDIPMSIWTYVDNSATHDRVLDETTNSEIFLEAMYKSSLNILKYKDKVNHLSNTLKQYDNRINTMTEKELFYYNKLLELAKEEK